VADDAVGLAIFRAKAEAVRDRGFGRSNAHLLAVDMGCSGVGMIDAEKKEGGLGSPGTEQAGNTDDFAWPYIQVECRNAAAFAVVGKADRCFFRITGLVHTMVLVRDLLQFATEHHGNQFHAGKVCDLATSNEPSIAQDRYPVCDRVYLVEKVRDDDDA